MKREGGAASFFQDNPLLLALVVLAAIKGIFLIFLVPPFQAPDEPTHYDYAVYLSKINLADFLSGRCRFSEIDSTATVTREVAALSDLSEYERIRFKPGEKVKAGLGELISKARGFKNQDQAQSLAKKKTAGGAFNYPPLYYGFLSLFLRAAGLLKMNIVVKFLMARLASFGLFLLSLIFAYKSLKIIGFQKYVIIIVFAVMALQPQLSWISISVQPDVAGILFINVCIFLSLRFITRSRARDFYLFHLAAGLLLLTKLQLFIVVYFPILLFFAIFRTKNKPSPIKSLKPWAIGFAILLAVGGWWYIRSLVFSHDIIGYISLEQTRGSVFANIKKWTMDYIPGMFLQFWGRWGWLDFSYPRWTHSVFIFLSGLPAPFWFIWVFSLLKKKNPEERLTSGGEVFRPVLLLPLGLTFAFFVLEMAAIAAFYNPWTNSQGRQWMPFILPMAVYIGGFYEFWRFRPSGSGRLLRDFAVRLIAYAYIAIFLVLDVWMIVLTQQRYFG
jgi:hypothetical protein